GSINLRVSTTVALYILNHKREYLQRMQDQRGLSVIIQIDDSLAQNEHSIERTETNEDFVPAAPAISLADLHDDFDDSAYDDEDEDDDEIIDHDDDLALDREDTDDDEPRERVERDAGGRDRGRGRGRRRGGRRDEAAEPA